MLSRLRMDMDKILRDFQNLLECAWDSSMPKGRLNHKHFEWGVKDMVSRNVPDANADTVFVQKHGK